MAFGLRVIGAALKDKMLFEEQTADASWSADAACAAEAGVAGARDPPDADPFTGELTRMLLRYLGAG